LKLLYESQARASENYHGIFKDDPEAIFKINSRVDYLCTLRDVMKSINRIVRKHGQCQESLEKIKALGVEKAELAILGFDPSQFRTISTEIIRLENRLDLIRAERKICKSS
jgi:hypothetical protein